MNDTEKTSVEKHISAQVFCKENFFPIASFASVSDTTRLTGNFERRETWVNLVFSMLISLLLIAVAAAGGFAVTYLVEDDAPFLWRLAAGNIVGSAVFGTAAFILATAFGLSAVTIAVSAAIALAPILLFYRDERFKRVKQDWSRAKSRLQGATGRKFLRFAYYAFFFLLFFFFFDRAMLESAAGIFTGGSQNLGDLPFHLGAIFSFTEANNFPPENPSFAGARFSYPFVADLLTACAVKLGAEVRDAMFIQNLSWAFSLLIILERFVFLLTSNRLAARLAPPLLFFSGGLGFIWAFGDYWSQTKGLFDFLSHLPKDYTITPDGFRWGNSMVVLFITQRSLLLGMPLTLIVLGYLWKQFATEKVSPETSPRLPLSPSPRLPFSPSPLLPFSLSPLLVGALAGLLPLIHLHSLAVLFLVGLVLLILKPEKWQTWAAFAVGVAVIAVPELLWSMAGSASETSKFFAWHFGWDKGDKNFFWFWFMNTGILIPTLAAGVYLGFLPQRRKDAKKKGKKEKHRGPDETNSPLSTHHLALLQFYLPFALLFLVSNTAKLAPWEWDNIKVLIYWFVGSLPFVALAIAWLWQREQPWWRAAATIVFVVLTAAGALDVWRSVSGQINNKVFDRDAIEIARQIKVRTPPDAMFLNAPTYNTAVVLSGRQSVMRYPGHLSSHGIDYAERESDVKRIYLAAPEATNLLEKYGVTHVLISPEERSLSPNEQFFSRYPVVAEAGQFKVYKIR